MVGGTTTSVPVGMGDIFYSNLLEAKMQELKKLLENQEACRRYEQNIVHTIRLNHKSTFKKEFNTF